MAERPQNGWNEALAGKKLLPVGSVRRLNTLYSDPDVLRLLRYWSWKLDYDGLFDRDEVVNEAYLRNRESIENGTVISSIVYIRGTIRDFLTTSSRTERRRREILTRVPGSAQECRNGELREESPELINFLDSFPDPKSRLLSVYLSALRDLGARGLSVADRYTKSYGISPAARKHLRVLALNLETGRSPSELGAAGGFDSFKHRFVRALTAKLQQSNRASGTYEDVVGADEDHRLAQLDLDLLESLEPLDIKLGEHVEEGLTSRATCLQEGRRILVRRL